MWIMNALGSTINSNLKNVIFFVDEKGWNKNFNFITTPPHLNLEHVKLCSNQSLQIVCRTLVSG